MTTAPLSARSLGPRGLDGGPVAGIVVGAVVGVALVLFLIFPFALRTIRRNRHGQGDDALHAEEGQSPTPGGRSSPPHFNESKRLSSDPVPSSSPDSESGHTNGHLPKLGSAIPNGNDVHLSQAASDHKPHPPALVSPAGVTIHQGIPSPTSPPLSPTTRHDSITKTPEDGQAYPTPPADDIPPPKPHHASISTRDNTRDLTLVDSSYGPPSRELTLTAQGITEEPESFETSSQSPTHRTFSRVSGSIRDFIRNQHRRGSRRSTHGGTDGARSPSASICTTEPLSQQEPVQPFVEEADINARGLAWSYFHDPNLVSDVETAYKPTAPSAAQPPFGLEPPALGPNAAPLSPVSLPDQSITLGEAAPPPLITQAVVSEPEIISPDSDITATPFRPYSLLRGPGSLVRTDSLPPLQPIVADFSDAVTTSPSGPSGRPMDLMGPSNDVEKSWRFDQEFLKNETPSPPMEAPLVYDYMPQASEPRYVQPHGLSPESDYQSPPGLALNDQQYDIDFSMLVDTEAEQQHTPYSYYTPPPSLPSNQNTPDTRISDYSPSPRSDAGPGSSVQQDSSPRFFPCDQCHRVFDQVHKLNHHKRYHDRPHECTHPGCTMRFGTKTHLDRHINDKHKKTRQFHCTEHGCPYSRQGGKSFPRKDNWRRHMMNKHQITPNTEPVEYGDSSMIG
ncbi:hypothetical protein B0T16DRAFT_451509 [Cercophora newfieldiana]|uniref:C2H2-type domain-containing protein n=1 Tax=Cercophora newfieldiana TaxID=92897 RepID=A0AA40CZ53_9PEZI|nr:hypothetical protein B0T16DRAFT_451509 [Cercophora newfieldiana]